MRAPLLCIIAICGLSLSLFVYAEVSFDCSAGSKHVSCRLGAAFCPCSSRKGRQTSRLRTGLLLSPGQIQEEPEKTVVILYHKPKDVITSHSKADAAPKDSTRGPRTTVYEDIESMQGHVRSSLLEGSFSQVTGIYSKFHAIGRLDVDTTGLLLLTNDGGLVHHVTNPLSSGNVVKTYHAIIMGRWNDTSLQPLRDHGVDIGQKYGGQTRPPQSLTVLGYPSQKTTLVEISISEGRNRQVRRMFHAIQSGVIHLKRVSISNLTLGDLVEGQWRVLSDSQVERHLDFKPRVFVPEKGDESRKDSSRRSSTKRKRSKRKRSSSRKFLAD